MRGGAEVRGEVGVFFDSFEGGGSAAVPVFSNESVDGFVFAEFLDSRSEDDELRVITEGHARAVNGLVSEPCGVKFVGVEIDNCLAQGLVQHFEVDLDGEGRRLQEAFFVVADVEAAEGEATVGFPADYGLHVDDGPMLEEAVGRVIEHGADGILRLAHDALHAVDGAEVMAAVDAFATAGADQNVLVVVGHSDNFMGHHLADGQDKIPLAVDDVPADLRGPGVMELALGLLLDEGGGDFAEGLDIGSPIVDEKAVMGDSAEHVGELIGAHGRVGAERREDFLETVSIILISGLGDGAGLGVEAGHVRRDGENTVAWAQFVEGGRQEADHLRMANFPVNSAGCTIQAQGIAPVNRVL